MYDLFAFSEPWQIAVTAGAVILVGMSKGGIGGAMALLGMVALSTAYPPVQAAGILLPILLVMDVVGLWKWRGQWDRNVLKIMLPGGLIGIAIGWLTASYVSEPAIRLIVGAIAATFVLRWAFAGRAARAEARPHHAGRATFWATVTGYTSFVAHAGGPPYQIYTLPLRMPPTVFTATSVLFFAIVNAVKVVPYFALGQFDSRNILTSLVMMPLAVLSVLAGVAIVKRIRAEVFYPIMYTFILIVSTKLIHDGVVGLIGG